MSSSPTAPLPWTKYQPTLDIATFPPYNPDLDMQRMTREQRLAYTRSLIELYFMNLQEWSTRRRNYNWWTHGYVADDYTFLYGPTNPAEDPKTGVTQAMGSELGGNQIASERFYASGLRPPHGSLLVIPNEGGAYFRFPFEGVDRDGVKESYWEVNYIVVNNRGLITHFEMWADMEAFRRYSKKVYGIDVSGPRVET